MVHGRDRRQTKRRTDGPCYGEMCHSRQNSLHCKSNFT